MSDQQHLRRTIQRTHVPDVQSMPDMDPPVFVPGCECGWFGSFADDVVHAARSAKDHARMSSQMKPIRHQNHSRQCDCLADSATCCDHTCCITYQPLSDDAQHG